MPKQFVTEISSISRREVERHQKRITGLTASAPRFVDVNGKLEWVCDVRVGNKENQGLIKDCLIAQWAIGVVNDVNIPVLLEKSEAGRITVIARSEVRLPNVALTSYTPADLGRLFFVDATIDNDGVYRDSFGHEVLDPTAQTGQSNTYTWTQEAKSIDEALEESDLEEFIAEWRKT